MSKAKTKLTYGSMIYLKFEEEQDKDVDDKVYYAMSEGF